MFNRLSAAGLLFILIAFGTSLSAQAPPPPAPPKATDEPAGRRIYVPVEDLDVVFDQDKQGVILPRAEYLKLAADAKKKLDETPQSTHKTVVSGAQYTARIQDDQLVISATVTFDQLARGWQMVTLPYRGLSVEAATLDDKAAKIGRAVGDGRPLVVLSQEPGKHVLKLELSVPLVTVGSDKVSAFGLAPISSAIWQMTLPAGKFLHIDEVPLERAAAVDKPADYTVAVGGKSSLALRITDRQTLQNSASLVFAGTSIGLHVSPEERTWRAVTSLSVFGKPIDNLTFVVPKALEIISVESTGLERWEIGDDENAATTTLKLVYRQPFSETRNVTFTGVSTSELGKPWSVPTLSLPGATSHLVRVLVQHPANLRLQQVEATAIRRVPGDEAAEPEMPHMPDMAVKVGASQMLYYAAWREDFSLQFVTQPRAREVQATIATRIDIGSRELALNASIAAQTRFAPLFDFDIALPVDWTVTDVLVENRPVQWRIVPIAAGLNQVRVLFERPIPADGKVNLTLAARFVPGENWPIEDQPLSIPLPEVSLPQVGVSDGRYMIAAEDDLDLAPEEVTGLDPVRQSAAEQQAAGAPRLVYEYQDTRFSGTLKISRKPLRVAAQTLAYHRLDRETLVTHLEARLVVQGGGLQKLVVALPEAAGTNLRFSLVNPDGAGAVRLPRITDQTSAEPANGQRVWTLQLDQRAFGLVWLVVDLTSPRSADAASFDLPGLGVVSADRQNGFVAIEGGPDQQLEVTAVDAAGQPLIDVDPADIPVARGYTPKERIVAAYRAVRAGFKITVKETRFDRQAVPTAFCDKARLTSIIGEGGQQQHKAEFLLRAVGVQSLFVELAGDANLWATLIDGQPTEVRTIASRADGSKAWIVPLPQGMNPGQAHSAQLFYGYDGQSLESSGKLTLVPPRIAAISGQGETQPIEILDREWILDHPAQTEITASSGQFEPLEKPSRVSFLGLLHRGLALASPGALGQKALWTVIVGGAIGIFFFAWRRRGVAGAAIAAALGLVLVVILTVISHTEPAPFIYALNGEKSAAEYYSDSTKLFAPTSAPPAGGENYWQEERYGKVPVQVPAGPAAAPADMAGVAMDDFNADGRLDEMVREQLESKGRGTYRELAKSSKRNEAPGITGTSGMPAAESAPPGSKDQLLQQKEKRQSEVQDSMRLPGAQTPTARSFARKKNGIPQPVGQPPRAVPASKSEDVGDGTNPSDGQRFAAPAGTQQGDDQQLAENDQRLRLPAGGLFAKGALLSLAIDLPVTTGNRKTAFRYTGTADPKVGKDDPKVGKGPVLEVEYQNRRALSFVSLAWQAGVLLVFWYARRWSAGMRATLGVLALLGPLALVALVPLDMLASLDGIFLGAVWGLLLWLVLALCARCRCAFPACCFPGAKQVSVLVLSTAIGGSCLSQSAVAQDQKPPAAAPAPAAAPQPAAEVKARTGAPTIVIPYDPAEDIQQAARVFLPWDKFIELWNAANPEKAAQPPAPTDGLVAEALYAVSIPAPAAGKKPTAEVSGRFVLHSFRDDQISLNLPLGRVALTQALLDGKSAALVMQDGAAGQRVTVVVPTRGVHVLDVKFSLPVEQAGAAGKVTLPALPVATGSLRFTLPANDLNLRVSGGAGTFRKVREKEQTIAIVPIDQGGDVSIAWTPAQTREVAQGIVHAESATAVSLGDAGLRLSSSFKYNVRQGAISDVSYSLPPGLLVRQIAGLDLGGWEIAGEGAERTLKVFLRRPVDDTTTVQFDLYRTQAFSEESQPVAVPFAVPQQVTRETGTVGIFAERQLTVTAGTMAGLAQIDLAQFVAPPPMAPAGVAAPAKPAPAAVPLLAYRFAARPVQLQLLVARQRPQSKGIAEHAVFVGARKLRIASRLELHLAGAPRSEMAIQLPAGYLLYDLKSNDTVDYHVENRPGENAGEEITLLIVDLSAPRTGTIELVLDGIVSRSPQEVAPKISVPVPLGIGELKSALAIWLDRIYTATLDDFAGWKSVDPGELPERLRAAQNTPLQFAFTSSQTRVTPVALTLNRAVPRLSGDALTVVIARDTSVQYLLYLRWNIAAAGESVFVFTTPDWLADRLEFDRGMAGTGIRQVASEKIAGNRLRWTVTLDDPRTVVSTLVAQAIMPPPDAGRIAAPAVVFEQPVAGENGQQYQALEQQHHYLVLVNQSPQRLEQESRDAVEAIPAVDLPIKISKTVADQATEILRIRDPKAAVGWRVQNVQQLKSLAASVNLAKMTLVLARDGSWRGEANYRINNRARQFLALEMPAGARVLSLFVAGGPSRPISPKRADAPNMVLVPLPKTAAGDLAVEVKLVYAGRFDHALPKGVQVLRSEVDLPAPQVVSQGEYGIPVAATEWTVILPPDIDAKRVDDIGRSNVAESDIGGEDLIARYNEYWNLSALALDSSQSMSVRNRSENNLKKLREELRSYSEIDARVTSDNRNLRQQGLAVELKGKVQQADRLLQDKQKKSGQSAQIFDGTSNTGYFNSLSAKDVQRDLFTSNATDFRSSKEAEEGESLPQLALQPTLPQDRKPDDNAPKKPDANGEKAQPQATNRRELREQTQAQSMRLNEALNAQPDPGRPANQPGEQKLQQQGKLTAQEADADVVFEQSNAIEASRKQIEKSLERQQAGFQFEGVAPGGPGGGAGGMGGMGGGMGGMGLGGGGSAYNQWPKHGVIAGLDQSGAFAANADGLLSDKMQEEGAIDRVTFGAGGGVAGWTTAGGLSLPIAIPEDGQKLTFSKSGGEARLALGLRPRASLEAGFSLAWTVVWLLVALGLIAALGRSDAITALVRRLPAIAAGVGLAWYFLLPAAPVGFALFVVGAVAFGWQHRRG